MPAIEVDIMRPAKTKRLSRRKAHFERIHAAKLRAKELAKRYSPYRKLAAKYVVAAIENGDLAVLDGTIDCVDCGDVAYCYDHRDYMKPLEVWPVCISCNNKRGSALNAWRYGACRLKRTRRESW